MPTPRTPSYEDFIEAERHLRLFLDGVRDYAVILLDPNGVVSSWNRGAKTIKGYASEEILGRHFSCFYTPEDVARDHPAFVLAQARQLGRFEEIGLRRRKDGTTFWANVIISAVYDDHETLVGFGKITRDISERVEAAEAVRQSDARLRGMVDTVLETLVDGLIVMDRDGIITVFNHASEKIFGYAMAEAIGQSIDLLIAKNERNADVRSHDQGDQESGWRVFVGKSHDARGRRKDGTTFPMRMSVGQSGFESAQIFVGVVHDLTEQNRIEEALRQSQKMDVVGQLTGGVAHDFNNILMVISANTEEILEAEGVLAPDIKDHAKRIEYATNRATDLTRQLLAFSRKQVLRPQRSNLNDLVVSTGNLLRRTLGEQIELDSILTDDLWIANIDRGQFETALVNLCINARDAMPDGGRLLIETKNVALDDDYVIQNPEAVTGDYAMVAVSDTGAGISRELLSRVFEPFFTTKGPGKGTGLGLSMVYGFIKQSKGHIKIYSEVGRGTSVKIYLPRVTGIKEEEHLRQSESVPHGTERILLVEDDPQVRASVLQQLTGLGYEVVEADNGAAALAAFEVAASPFSLLLTDVVMPGAMSGKVLAFEATRRSPETKIVFMSGYTENAIVHHGQLDPGVLLLSKPFRRRDLAQMIRKALDSKNEI